MAAKDKDKKSDEKYNRLKEFEGSRYSGMKIGASHKWYYDQGEWKERKITPDEWDVYYETTKRRAGKAPKGSGAPVGTEYNWLIVAHQRVDKIDANSYLTCLDGKKFKIAHKRAAKNQWSITEKTQRKKVIRFLEGVIQDIKNAGEEEQLPYTVGETERIYGLNHKNKRELYEMAVAQNIPNRSKMSRGELLEKIKNNQDGQQPDKIDKIKGNISQKLGNNTRDELYKMAQERRIRGRSEMKKEELVKNLRRATKEKELA